MFINVGTGLFYKLNVVCVLFEKTALKMYSFKINLRHKMSKAQFTVFCIFEFEKKLLNS